MKVKPKVEPGNVKVHGKGVSTTVGIPASIPVDFTVDTTEAGFGDLEVQVLVRTVVLNQTSPKSDWRHFFL
jgi:filamin